LTSESKEKKEELAKTTVEVPRSLLKQWKQKCLENNKKMRHVLLNALKLYFSLRSNLDFDEAYHEATWRVQFSSDPEDTIELPLSIDDIKILHRSIHIALKKAGEPTNEET
jgi:SNF2 family DNA or RNA helicase